MVLECLDRLFCWVPPVVVRGYQLVRHLVELDCGLEYVGTFVVKDVFLGEDARIV